MDGEADIVLLDCPECGDDEQEVVRSAPAAWVLRCVTCGFTRTVPAPRRERPRPVPVILSQGPTSTTRQASLDVDAIVAAGDELQLDGHRVLVKAVECHDGTRPAEAPVRDVKVLYAVVFDTVALHYTVNQGDVTRSFQEEVAPEAEVHVGSVREVQGVRLAVKTLKSDQNRTLHRGYLLARNVRRIFADVAPEGAPPGSKVKTRRRGRGTGPPKRSRTPAGRR